MTSLEADASSRVACKSSFRFTNSRSKASLKLRPDLGESEAPVGELGVGSPAVLLDFLSRNDFRILVKAYKRYMSNHILMGMSLHSKLTKQC